MAVDVFLSYAHIDDLHDGAVSALFRENLKSGALAARRLGVTYRTKPGADGQAGTATPNETIILTVREVLDHLTAEEYTKLTES
jgi:hypothetical protein